MKTDTSGAMSEIAQMLWHRFAPEHYILWEDETHKSEYMDAAQQALQIADQRQPSPQPAMEAVGEWTAEALGFNEKECGLITEMLAEKDLAFKPAVKAALRLYQMVHKGTMDGADFALFKDGKRWPYTGPMLANSCENCGGTGKYFVGFSGQESDGNAPCFEPCDECASPPAASAEAVAVPFTAVIQAIRAAEAENSRRGGMYPQTADEHREDRAASRRTIGTLEFLGKSAEALRDWPSAAPPADLVGVLAEAQLSALQTMARFILFNADKFEWSLQGLGMLRLYLPGDVRLHVWDTRFASPGASPIHDHLQWGLTSTIISGRLTNHRYKEGSGEQFHWARFKDGYNAKQLHEPETMLLDRQPAEVYSPGNTYSQQPNEIHETQAEWGTVTLMQKRPTADGETARIFWPAGTEWGSAEPRKATAEEVRAITSYALAALSTKEGGK